MIADWYFDFVSPFAYLQSEKLGGLPARKARLARVEGSPR
jgi:2-hydroxychromene-2-carboxylate isomerase